MQDLYRRALTPRIGLCGRWSQASDTLLSRAVFPFDQAMQKEYWSGYFLGVSEIRLLPSSIQIIKSDCHQNKFVFKILGSRRRRRIVLLEDNLALD